MLTVSCAVAGMACLCWPAQRAVPRLRGLYPREHRGTVIAGVNHITGLAVPLCSIIIGLLFLGPAGAVVGGLLGGTAWRRWHARREGRARTASCAGLADALGHFVAELRAGAHPAAAAESAARDAALEVAVALRVIASSSRLGGDVDAALARAAASTPALRAPLTQLGRAWLLAQRHGLPLAEVVDAVRRDLEAERRFAAQLRARMAGPRASAAVLAGLPLLGLALGEAMGARPVHVLSSSVAGQFLLLVGAALIWLGVLWSAKLTGWRAPW